VSNGDGKVVKLPIRLAGGASDRADVAFPEMVAGAVAELIAPRQPIEVIAEKILSAMGDDQNASWDEDVSRTADYVIEAYGSPEAAAVMARRLERDSDLPGFARAVRVEIERRATGKV